MTVINFDDHFRDRMGEVDRGHIEVFPKLWNLRFNDKTNGEVTRNPRLTAVYHKLREKKKGCGDYKKLPEEIPEFPSIRRAETPQCCSIRSLLTRVKQRGDE